MQVAAEIPNPPGMTEFVTAIAQAFHESSAANYLTFTVQNLAGDSYEVTVRRAGGKTPGQRIEELERLHTDAAFEAADLRSELVTVRTSAAESRKDASCLHSALVQERRAHDETRKALAVALKAVPTPAKASIKGLPRISFAVDNTDCRYPGIVPAGEYICVGHLARVLAEQGITLAEDDHAVRT
jgi:hypothetical protein